ncbi:hypothetical protein Poly30_09380 [Planctomycetes bacterium Poly30]|uniref:Uncharacterized protein n=1 Tax=Saltatorellus ferox TaxID=2528018 RepID=A0A518EMZ7_9BACT|nr:hypothetical protein Poly30_09380 [Planctomycetes bacterium Poly30]
MKLLTYLGLASASVLPSASFAASPCQLPERAAAAVGTAEATEILRFTVPVAKLDFGDKVPAWSRSMWLQGASSAALLPRAVIHGWHATVELPASDDQIFSLEGIRSGSLALARAAGELDEAAPTAGVLYLPDFGEHGLEAYPFTIPASAAERSDVRWREIEASRYRALASESIPGAAWFRRRADSLGGPATTEERGERRRSRDVGETFAMFTGGRALAENLALDDVIRETTGPSVKLIELSTLDGVEVPEMDFAPLVEALENSGEEIALDPLGRAIPHDQHAAFFPSFAALLRVADQVDDDSAPLVQLFEGRSQNARVRERYETQMCLSLGGLARTFGSQFVESVAVTGSDTYLRTGSDVAVLFQGSVAAIRGMMLARIEASAKEFGVDVQYLEIEGASVTAAVSRDRALSVYLAAGSGFVIVANSPVQVARVLKADRGEIVSLDELPEYRWFRHRYPVAREDGAGEDALLVVSDATIRRWSGARWRIATSRRVRAAALLADADAWRLGYRMGISAEDEARRELAVRGGGEITYDTGFAMDSVYGRSDFLTPIAELDVDLVTESERNGYVQWREMYEAEWTTAFDPIAISLDVEDGTLSVDLTLVPLVVRTDYRELMDIAGDVKLKPGAGDYHADAILHWVSAIDTRSRMYRSLTGFIGSTGNGRLDLDWVGEHIAVYVDQDEDYLERISRLDDMDYFSEEMLPGLPIGVEIGVKSPLKLAAFLTGLRAFVEDAVPGMFEYQTREHEGRKYVAIVPSDTSAFPGTPSVYYVAQPGAWVVSLSENVIRGAIGRSVARKAAEAGGVAASGEAPWTGASTGLHVGSGIREAFAVELFELAAREQLRNRSWANLPILNEWKEAGVDDPAAFHEAEWGIELLCAGGGQYVWNDEDQTMESTVFGHPAAAKKGPLLPPALERLRGLDGSLDFEEIGGAGTRGLRARVQLHHE